LRNSFHFSGSWLNHFRSGVLGATSFIHASRCSASFFTPRGHRRSTRTRLPSDLAGGSYARLRRISVIGTPCGGEAKRRSRLLLLPISDGHSRLCFCRQFHFGHAYGFDAAISGSQHFKSKALMLEALAGLRNAPGDFAHQSADGTCLNVVTAELKEFLEFVEVRRPGKPI